MMLQIFLHLTNRQCGNRRNLFYNFQNFTFSDVLIKNLDRNILHTIVVVEKNVGQCFTDTFKVPSIAERLFWKMYMRDSV
jgi:hypothetical protein